MLNVRWRLQGLREDISEVIFGRDSPYSATSFNVRLTYRMVANIDGTRNFCHVGLRGEVLSGLVITIQVVWRIHGISKVV